MIQKEKKPRKTIIREIKRKSWIEQKDGIKKIMDREKLFKWGGYTRNHGKGGGMGIDLTKDEMKNRVLNYLDYLSEKDHQEIMVVLYNITKRRQESKKKIDTNEWI